MRYWSRKTLESKERCPDEVYLAAGDDVIVTTAGTCTHGLDRFLASWYGQPMPGRAFCTVSLVRVQPRRALPLRVAPVARSDAEQAASQANTAAKQPQVPPTKRRPGGLALLLGGLGRKGGACAGVPAQAIFCDLIGILLYVIRLQ